MAGFEASQYIARNHPWMGDAMLTIETAAISLPIIGAIIAAGSAIDSSRIGYKNGYQLSGISRRGRLSYIWQISWATFPSVLAHILGIVICISCFDGGTSSSNWVNLFLAVSVQSLAISFFATLGSCIGRGMPSIPAALISAMISYSFIFLNKTSGVNVIDFGGATISRIGLDYSREYLVIQLAYLLLSILAVFLLLPVVKISKINGFETGLVSALIVLPLLFGVPVANASRIIAKPTRPSVCFDQAPRICVFTEQKRAQGTISWHIKQLADDARAGGYGFLVPNSLTATSRTFSPGRNNPSLSFDQIADPTAAYPQTEAEWISAITFPANCPEIQHVDPSSYMPNVQKVANAWMKLYFHEKPNTSIEETKRASQLLRSCKL